jgi:uncharacterized protein YheU (UPF0270 family)
MEIPYDQLNPQTLRALVEEYVTRDGTDLTEARQNVDRVIDALKAGRAVIEFDEEEGTTTIIPVEPRRPRR